MVSWKPKNLAARTYRAGDFVELRAEAEQGLTNLYQVRGVRADGALQLDRVSRNGVVTVGAANVAEDVFPARAEILATQARRA
ncbi:hypothetical protein B5P44_00145 [Mycobacterium sp. CBMA 213]|uniref:Uncharacterized protein n=1 Tax=Mycolicibacterium sp. CBMA 213 TaxID=1968788 RepID=A0A343VR06_9MYCO|nr:MULTISPECIES: hypothetical protein [unclassified Mycolicibacterium]AVN58330.1 hypothetical protein B5P44_p00035 [Mycolicibacterium sp. CBMA 213]MUL60995.1 hypothetical protein [Mycolicibacterium sp. CBMA 335]MUM03232.1 hypothetical protein [Mycolicibacterium sp. CBMA 213]